MDLIYELLQDQRHPSYGYFLGQDKTVWPERWSAIGGSQIHTCYTGIGGYFIKGFGGIRPDPEHPGMQEILIKPATVGDLTHANTEYQSMYGKVVVNWKKEGKGAKFHIEVPMNTTAEVYLPAIDKDGIKENGVLAESAKGIQHIGEEKNDAVGNYVLYKVTSGSYDFVVDELPKTSYPEPLNTPDNLSLIGRMNASSMTIQSEKLPVFEAFRANDEDSTTRWWAAESKNQYLEVEWVKPQTFHQIIVDEYENNIQAYKMQYWENGEWKDIVQGTTCGTNKTHQFDAVKTTKCRLFIAIAKQKPSITELKILYNE
jgi:alpha-L-rhamnosidase